ncbi:MAG TPA: FxSxx-COOH system tetratricopeptide repeat protein [Blastocatellia bacterium]|nr:FxSxx-COOH system tetratricopeptide repeat protein [Blastocatellia bacterium]
MEFFISYNKADLQWAEWIAWQLEEAGYTTMIRAWDIRPGGNFALDTDEGLQKAERVVAVISPDYLSSRFTKPEWAVAFAQDSTGEDHKLLPVRVRECDLKGLLAQIVYIDLIGGDEAEAKDRLLNGVKRERAKPATSPQFPGETTAARSVAARPNFPGAIPPVWNVPHRENPHFVGRDELLDQIHKTLNSGQAAARTAIHGLGGVGKTQLAAHYAHRHKGDYQIVWWIKAEEPATLAGDYAALATALDLPEKDAREQPVIVAAVRRWLEQNPGWLLIFDNARSAEEIRAYLPQGRAGQALITSRAPNWRGIASPLEVHKLAREDAALFLLDRTGQRDEAAARALAAELGDLPLALEQAGAYIEETGETLARYTELFRTRRRELQREERPPAGYPDTVATTWLLSFQQAEQQSPAAADLLRLCAFFAPDDIPLSMLVAGVENLPAALAAALTDQIVCNKTIAALRRYSLITKQDDSLSVHRLVQLVTRDRLTEDERRQWVEAVVRVISQAFPFESDEVWNWPISAKLLPHAQVVVEWGASQADPDTLGQLLNQTGLYLLSCAQYAEAKQAFERALQTDEAAFGPDHPRVATAVCNLGVVLQNLGELVDARNCYERALRIDVVVFGPDHPNVATRVSNLGTVMQALGDLRSAREYCERALRIDEVSLGINHPNVGRDANNLGEVLRNLGNFAGARDCYKRALRISEVTLGLDHPNVAICVSNLGIVLQALGDLAGARACAERALYIDEVALGHDHPNVAIRVNNLGLVLQALGDLEGARNCLERALRIYESALGSKHPQLAIFANNLGLVLHDLGDLTGAQSCYRCALHILTDFLGEDHPDTVTVWKNLKSLG